MNKAKTKISTCVLTSSYPHGEEGETSVFIRRLVEGFANYSMSGVVVTPFDYRGAAEEVQGLYKVYRVKYGIFFKGSLAAEGGGVSRLRKNPFLMLQVPGLIFSLAYKAWKLKDSYNVVQANWLPVGAAALLVKCLTKKPYVLTIHGSDMKFISLKIFNPLFKLILRNASYVVSVNTGFLNTLEKLGKLDDSKLKFIPNGVSYTEPSEELINEVVNQYGLDKESNYLIHIGRVIPLKRIEEILEILQHESLKKYKLLIVGRAVDKKYLGSLMSHAQELGIENRVRFLGPANPKLIPALLKLATAYVSFSSHEGRPMSVLEALAAGLPVLASDIDGHQEIITHEKNGFLFKHGEREQLIKTLLLLEDNKKLREEVCEAGKLAISEFTWSATAKQYQDLFRSMV